MPLYSVYNETMLKKHKFWKYQNLTMVCLGILVAIWLVRQPDFVNLLHRIGGWGYIGAFFAGMLFASTFTVAIGAVILLIFAETLHPIEIGLVAGLGGMFADLIILKFFKSGLSRELQSLFNYFDPQKHVKHLLHSKYFSWSLPVIGAIVIASPLPDELGVSLMGISRMKRINFMIVSYLLNSAGIFLVVSASIVVKP